MNDADERARWQPDDARRGRLLARIAAGELLRDIVEDPDMPSRTEIFAQVWDDPQFAEAFHAARLFGAEAMAEECLAIADEPVDSAGEVARNRLRIDTRLKLMARWERAPQRQTRRAPARPAQRINLSTLTTEQLEVLVAIDNMRPREPRRPPAEPDGPHRRAEPDRAQAASEAPSARSAQSEPPAGRLANPNPREAAPPRPQPPRRPAPAVTALPRRPGFPAAPQPRVDAPPRRMHHEALRHPFVAREKPG